MRYANRTETQGRGTDRRAAQIAVAFAVLAVCALAVVIAGMVPTGTLPEGTVSVAVAGVVAGLTVTVGLFALDGAVGS